MNCQAIEERLTSYLLGDLGKEEAQQVRRHLEACDGCRALARELEPTLDLLRDALAASDKAPARLDPARVERILRAREPVLPNWLAMNWGLLARAAAVVVVSLGLLAVLFLPALSRSRGKAEVAMKKAQRAGERGAIPEPAAEAAYEMAQAAPKPSLVEIDEEVVLGTQLADAERRKDRDMAESSYARQDADENKKLPGEEMALAWSLNGKDKKGLGGAAGVASTALPKRLQEIERGFDKPAPSAAEEPASHAYYRSDMSSVRESRAHDEVRDVVAATADDFSVSAKRMGARERAPVDNYMGDRVDAVQLGRPATVSGTAVESEMEWEEAPEVEVVLMEKEAETPVEQVADFASLDTVGEIESPLVMKGLFAGRSAGGRAAALGQYGGAWGKYSEAAALKSLEWLKNNQQADGSWDRGEPDATSLGLLAFLAHGETPISERYGTNVEKALGNLIQLQDASGRFSTDPNQHALATYALGEAYGLTRIPALKPVLEKATQSLALGPAGEAAGGLGEASRLNRVAQAVKSAELAGVTNEEIATAVEQASRELNRVDGPANVLGLQLLGQGKTETVQNRLAHAEGLAFDWNQPRSMEEWLSIHQAKFHLGGKAWSDWNQHVAGPLTRMQNEDGSWPARTNAQGRYESPAVSTALSALMLQTHYRFLPTLKPDAVAPAEDGKEGDIEIIIEDEPATEPEPEDDPGASLFKAYGVNPFVSAERQPVSTFSIDVDTASYTLARNYLLNGLLPPAEAVRTEEFVNFFDYGYRPPSGRPFAVYTDCAPTPFGEGHLLKIGVKGKRLGREEQRPAVLTLVLDTSGSMNTPDRIGLVRQALDLLLDRLAPADQVALVQYDSHARLVLEHTPASERDAIRAALERLQVSGSTHLEEGLQRGYAAAAGAYDPRAINRVLLLSDGVANLGSDRAEQILETVTAYRKQGIFLSVFGFGLGTYNDELLETLADRGDGTYQFIDSLEEAERVFVEDLAATLHVIARDVKIQVEFDPARVVRYRQVGYENRLLAEEDFRDDTVDAGEVGSGQSVTALYEVVLRGDPPGPLGTVRIRYRDTASGQVEEMEQRLASARSAVRFEDVDPRFRLAAAVAAFAEMLRGSPYADGYNFEAVARVLRPLALDLHRDPRVRELARLVHSASSLPRAGS